MNIRHLWIILLSISVVLFLFQVSVDNINQDGGTVFNYNGSVIASFDAGDYNLNNDVDGNIPELPAEVTTTDNSFTDIFQSIGTWFKNTKGGQLISGLYYGVPNLLKGLGMPPEFSYALGFFYHALAIFSFVIFMRGNL